MCRIGSGASDEFGGHGPRFLRKLRRLLRLVAPARLLEDLATYDGTPLRRYLEACRAEGKPVTGMPFRVAGESDLEAIAEACPTIRWARLERYLTKTFTMTAAQLRRACPWAEAEWRRLSAAIREDIRLRKAFEQQFGNRRETGG